MREREREREGDIEREKGEGEKGEKIVHERVCVCVSPSIQSSALVMYVSIEHRKLCMRERERVSECICVSVQPSAYVLLE